jgi:hypothetical protein
MKKVSAATSAGFGKKNVNLARKFSSGEDFPE